MPLPSAACLVGKGGVGPVPPYLAASGRAEFNWGINTCSRHPSVLQRECSACVLIQGFKYEYIKIESMEL